MTVTSRFKVGDVVRLDDTFMRMIVIRSNYEVTECAWYDAEGQRNHFPFVTVDLELAPVQGGRFPGRR